MHKIALIIGMIGRISCSWALEISLQQLGSQLQELANVTRKSNDNDIDDEQLKEATISIVKRFTQILEKETQPASQSRADAIQLLAGQLKDPNSIPSLTHEEKKAYWNDLQHMRKDFSTIKKSFIKLIKSYKTKYQEE